MKNFFLRTVSSTIIRLLLAAFLALAGVTAYYYLQLLNEEQQLQVALSEIQAKLAINEQALKQTQNHNDELSTALQSEKQLTTEYTGRISSLSETVSTYEKLHHLDPELLKKYSKVYFLNENYNPVSLSFIATSSLYDKSKVSQLYTNVLPYLDKLIASASADKVALEVVSAYRSFATQAAIKSQYKVIYGKGANQFSSDQGYSEHQLGTTVDLTTPKVVAMSLDFAKSPAYAWLQANAHKYGFVLSYPKQNQYYQFEPWHWRFVGVELATKLHNENKFFYDLDQHEIDVYLIKIFDL
jgi:D-alanyl-D-alanine carboxypeptidase